MPLHHLPVLRGPICSGFQVPTGEIAIGLGAFDLVPTGLASLRVWVGNREKWFEVVAGTDLAVVPGLRTGAFWNQIFDIIPCLGGSIATPMRTKAHREQAFIQEQDRKIDSSWDWLQLKPDEIRQVLGFFIGEPPVDPFAPALATGPP